MRPAFYSWKLMARDYARLVLDDKWHWCVHCRRPVEHAMVTPDAHPEQSGLACLDCGTADPDFLRLNTHRPTNTDS